MQEIKLDDFVLRFIDEGQGEPLLFVHGFPLDHSMWQHQLEALRVSHRCIIPDLRGFGASTFQSELISMKQLADDLSRLLNELSIDQPVTFCGLSMGGYIAWQFLQHHRTQLAKLILCDTKASADSEEVARGRQMMAQQVLVEGSQLASKSMLPKLVSSQTAEQQPELVDPCPQHD